MSKPLYTETSSHGPEVDFGVWWKATTAEPDTTWRVTWEAFYAAETGWSERGNVVAHAAKTGETKLLARDVPLFVVEHFLSQPYHAVGIAGYDPEETGWVVAMSENTLTWVERRLARWNGCDVVTYNGKERYQGEVKAARAYAAAWGFTAAGGGWIYDRQNKPFTQGWRSFSAGLKASRVIAPIRQETTGTDYRDRRYSETWVVSTTKTTFGA